MPHRYKVVEPGSELRKSEQQKKPEIAKLSLTLEYRN